MHYLSFRAPLAEYESQARELLDGWLTGQEAAVQVFRHHHPRFLDGDIPWLPRPFTAGEMRDVSLGLVDARLALAHWYSFRDWSSLTAWLAAAAEPDSDVGRFEAAVDAVVSGDARGLADLLHHEPGLIYARSTIISSRNPPRHRATLLHYVAANAVEDYRQRTPPNAVEVATLLLRAGAEPDALADMYGGRQTTMNMLVSSAHPALAGLQVPLVETLLDFGAAVDGPGTDAGEPPVLTALAFGYLPAAEALAGRGARVDTLAAAAGLGRLDAARRRLPAATSVDRHRGLALAAQHGQTPVLRALLDAGEDPNRFNPPGTHTHSTPLHQAALGGHLEAVQLLVERGARVDVRDTVWKGTPLDWAEHGHQAAVAHFLRALQGS